MNIRMNLKIRFAFLAVCLLATLFVRARHFRFAQLTDIHLTGSEGPHTDDLMRSIAHINASQGIDFVLVTGDVSECGDRATLLAVKECLSHLQVPYYIVLGNHETKWSDSGCTAWQQVFGYERFQYSHQGVHFLGFNTGPLMRMALGHVVPQDLSWLEECMAGYPASDPVVIVTHYPLMEGDVDNWYQATELLRRHNVRLCIGGHYHAMRNLSYDGVPGVLVRANYRSDAQDRGGYGLYEVTDDSIHVSVQEIDMPAVHFASFPLHGDRPGTQDPIRYPSDADNVRYAQVERVWLQHTGVGIYSSPCTDGRRVYVGDDLGRLSAYDLLDGRLLWTAATGARIVGTPAVDKGRVVTGSADGSIYAFDAKSGCLRWRHECQGPVLGAVTIHRGMVFVGASDGCMRALSLRAGRLVWQYDQVKDYIETKPLVTASSVVFGAWDNTLYALDRKTGREQWQWHTQKTHSHYSPAAVWPVTSHDMVFIADPERALTAVDLATGAQVWRTKQSMVRETVGLSADGRRIYSKTMQDSLVCYSAEERVPRELWACNVGFGYEHAPSMPVEKDGVVYGSTKAGMVFAVEAFTGRLLWRHHVGNSLISTVVPLSGRRVLFTSTDGTVGLLSVKE